jgi:hypothetical protein
MYRWIDMVPTATTTTLIASLDLVVVRVNDDHFHLRKCRWTSLLDEKLPLALDKKGLKKLLREIKRMRRESERLSSE